MPSLHTFFRHLKSINIIEFSNDSASSDIILPYLNYSKTCDFTLYPVLHKQAPVITKFSKLYKPGLWITTLLALNSDCRRLERIYSSSINTHCN